MFSLLKYVLGAVTDGTFVDRYIHVPNQTDTQVKEGYQYLETAYGKIRLFYGSAAAPASSTGLPVDVPTILLSPDPPNVIEMQMSLIERLRTKYNVVSFEIPGAPSILADSAKDEEVESG
jgi:hypothetical protein